MEGRLAVDICKSAKHSSSSTVLFISVPVVAHHSISINSFFCAEGMPHSCTSLYCDRFGNNHRSVYIQGHDKQYFDSDFIVNKDIYFHWGER